MVDLHSHILPGIDDGARTIEDSLALLSHSVESGVTHILATPHLNIGTFDNNIDSIEVVFNAVCEEVATTHLNVEIAFAAEVRICPEIMLLAKQKKLPFLGKYQGNDLLLLEFPDSHIPPGSDKLVSWLLKHNITPLIAHPERNRDLWHHPYLINNFVKQGCLLQLTAASLLGDFGDKPEKLAWQYLEADQVFAVASDMHNMKRRPNRLADAFALIESKISRSVAQDVCLDNPRSIFLSNPTARSFKGGV